MNVPAYATAAANGWKDTTVLVTAGGNDALTVDGKYPSQLLTACIFNDENANCNEDPDNQIDNWAHIEGNLVRLYNNICSSAPNADIKVMAYPELFQPEDSSCDGAYGINADEANWIDNNFKAMNQLMKQAITISKSEGCADVNIRLVKVKNYSTTGACSTNDDEAKHIRGITYDNKSGTFTDAGFHPTQLGYDAFYEALINHINVD